MRPTLASIGWAAGLPPLHGGCVAGKLLRGGGCVGGRCHLNQDHDAEDSSAWSLVRTARTLMSQPLENVACALRVGNEHALKFGMLVSLIAPSFGILAQPCTCALAIFRKFSKASQLAGWPGAPCPLRPAKGGT